MKRENNKTFDKGDKIALLNDLVALLPDIESNISKTEISTAAAIFRNIPKQNHKNFRSLLALSGPLYFILGSGSKLVHHSGLSYKISSKKDFVNQLTIATQTVSDAEILIMRHLDSYLASNAGLDDLWLYHMILDKLRVLGFDLEYTGEPTLQNITERANLQRIAGLIESLKNFLAGDALKDKFLDEYILLHVLNLPEIQKEVQDQILFKRLDDLAPSKLLMAYYKVYQKLPLGCA